MPNKMERFTKRARRVLSLASEAAERLNHQAIAPEHLLYGLLAEDEGIAAVVLKNLGLSLGRVDLLIQEHSNIPKRTSPSPNLDLSDEVKRVLEMAVDEAQRMGHPYIGTEHLLLALVRQNDTAVENILAAFGVTPENVRNQVSHILQSGPPPELAPTHIPPHPIRQIVISYRLADGQAAVDRLYDQLVTAFGGYHVFQNITSVPLGVDFRAYLQVQVSSYQVMLVVIGRDWERLMTEQADQWNDYVRLEIEYALKQNKLVIPVLIDAVEMPAPDKLPESIRNLAYRQPARLRPDPDFQTDCKTLIAGIKAALPK